LVSRPGTLAEITIVDRFKQNLKVYKPWENRVLHVILPSIKRREFGTDSAIYPKHFFGDTVLDRLATETFSDQ
jgi:hypothetical protein